MKAYGGFEGNAQTLHILARLEKKQTINWNDSNIPNLVNTNGRDTRCGLNLCARTLAAILKYDSKIPLKRGKNSKLAKGYYSSDAEIVKFIKKYTIGSERNVPGTKFKTIECSIMDVADDIAYSTYDLEDAFKANFSTPTGMLSASDELMEKIAKEVQKEIKDKYRDAPKEEQKFVAADARRILVLLFDQIFEAAEKAYKSPSLKNNTRKKIAAAIMQANATSRELTNNGYYRTDFTSFLVGRFINNVEALPNEKYPMLSGVRLKLATFKEVEVLKRYSFESHVMSAKLKITAVRGQEIVERIFKALVKSDGQLLPHDFKSYYKDLKTTADKRRLICDFVAGMTDRYAVEYYERLFGTAGQTVYKPL